MSSSETPSGDAELTATELANRLVWFGSQLQRWGAARTPSQNDAHITFSQVSLLYLVRYGVSTPGAVAKVMMITPRAVTSHVDALEAKQLLTRGNDPRDRRLVRLSLTERGEQVSREIENTALQPLVEQLDSLSADDKASMRRSVGILAEMFPLLRTQLPD